MIPISIAHEYVIIQQDDYHRIKFYKQDGAVIREIRGQAIKVENSQVLLEYTWHNVTDEEFGTRMTPAEFDELTAFVRKFFFTEKEDT